MFTALTRVHRSGDIQLLIARSTWAIFVHLMDLIHLMFRKSQVRRASLAMGKMRNQKSVERDEGGNIKAELTFENFTTCGDG